VYLIRRVGKRAKEKQMEQDETVEGDDDDNEDDDPLQASFFKKPMMKTMNEWMNELQW